MGFGGAINDLIDTLSRASNVSDANPMYAYRRLPQTQVTKRLPEGFREGMGAMDMRRTEPDMNVGWRSHFGSGLEPVPDDALGFDPKDTMGPTRGDRARAGVFRDAQYASALRMIDDLVADAKIADDMYRAADEVEMERKARGVGRKSPFDVSVKYAGLPGVAPNSAVGIAAEQAQTWADLMLEGDPVIRNADMNQLLRSRDVDGLPPRVVQALEEQLAIRQSQRMADSVEGDTMRFERDMNRIANPPRVGGETALQMLKRGGGAMGMPALDVLSLLMGAAAGRDPLDAGPAPVQFMDDDSRRALELATVGM